MKNELDVSNVVNRETGEILTTIREGDRILRAKSEAYLAETIPWNPGPTFVKVHQVAAPEVYKVLSPSELRLFGFMQGYVRYGSGIVAYSNGNHLTADSISKELNRDTRTINATLKSLYDKRIIGYWDFGDEVKIIMNPYIVSVGSRIDKSLRDMFANSEWARMYDKYEKRQKKNKVN